MPKMKAEEIEAFIAEVFPQAKRVPFVIESLDDEQLLLRFPVNTRHLRPGGTVSGPVLMTLCDTGMYYFLLSKIGRVPLAYTTNLNINFLRTPRAADLLADVRMLKLGKRLAVGDVSIRSEGHDEIVAHATVTYSIPAER